MVSSARVRLFEVDPDLGSQLSADELAEARQLAIPVIAIQRYDDLRALEQHEIFAALILDGMVLRQVRIADQLGMRLLGPGDIVPLGEGPPPMVVVDSSFRALPGTRLGLLGRELLFAASRWPALVAALQQRLAQQADRLTAQLVICQLPRVDQRLLALLWLLAEAWGRVTPAGTSVPLRLTHEALGALIGARRPTVTLALRELSERGAIIRQHEGWLLLDSPPGASRPPDSLQIPTLIEAEPSGWEQLSSHEAAASAAAAADSFAALTQTVASLREQHARDREQFSDRLAAIAMLRKRCQASRGRIASDRLRRQHAPSS